MHTACKERAGGMLTLVGLEEATVQHLCLQCREALPGSELCIANYLFPKGYVVSGSKEAVTLMRERASGLEATIKEVPVSGAFHSTLMTSAVSRLQKGLASADITLPRLPVYSNVTGLPYSNSADIRVHLAEQITRPVLWEGTVQNMIEREGGESELSFVEVGPGRQLRAMLKRINKDSFRKCINFEASK